MLLYFVFIYLVLARIFKLWSRTVQIHSIVHCMVAFLWTSYILFIRMGNNIFSTNFMVILQNINDNDKYLLILATTHSMGYFIADTIDILIDWNNKKRRIYILHHIAAIVGLTTVYIGSYIPIYAIWCLEIGGIVHHLKHGSEVYKFGKVYTVLTHITYHIVYLFSRILLGINTFKEMIIIYKSNNILADMLGLVVALVLLVQNGLWWVHNVRKSVGGYLILPFVPPKSTKPTQPCDTCHEIKSTVQKVKYDSGHSKSLCGNCRIDETRIMW